MSPSVGTFLNHRKFNQNRSSRFLMKRGQKGLSAWQTDRKFSNVIFGSWCIRVRKTKKSKACSYKEGEIPFTNRQLYSDVNPIIKGKKWPSSRYLLLLFFEPQLNMAIERPSPWCMADINVIFSLFCHHHSATAEATTAKSFFRRFYRETHGKISSWISNF
jgi:hypothetical protein